MQPALRPVVPAPGAPVTMGQQKNARGAKPGTKRGPSRAPEVVFRGKIESTFKTANRLLEKLESLRDSRHVRGSEAAAKQYVAFLTKLSGRIQDSFPAAQVTATESLNDWITG